MLMRPEVPIGRRRLNDTPVKELLIIAAFAVIGAAVALGIAREFPVPGGAAAEWLAELG
jgi:hypothetical protein